MSREVPPGLCHNNTHPESVNGSDKRIIYVYIDDGRIFEYAVESEWKVREHSDAIIKGGYRHNDGIVFEHYPPHRIVKIKSYNISTNYQDITKGT